MSQLPLIVRRDVRDVFEAPTSKVQQMFTELKDEIGYPVTCSIDWHLLWAECEPQCPDKAVFVPYVVSMVASLCKALLIKLDDESLEFAEQLLEKIASTQAVKIRVQTAPQAAIRRRSIATTSRLADVSFCDGTFILVVAPKPESHPAAETHLLSQLDSLFSAPVPQATPENTDADEGDEGDDWAPVDVQQSSILTPTTSTFSLPLRFDNSQKPTSAVGPLPTLAALPRPDLLFTTKTPHIIHLHRQITRITISSTHAPSLQLIHDYFTKWTRGSDSMSSSTRDHIPILRYTLRSSALGPGRWPDILVIEPWSGRSGSVTGDLNAALFQAFIEGVLGYVVVEGKGDGEFWEFRRETPFT